MGRWRGECERVAITQSIYILSANREEHNLAEIVGGDPMPIRRQGTEITRLFQMNTQQSHGFNCRGEVTRSQIPRTAISSSYTGGTRAEFLGLPPDPFRARAHILIPVHRGTIGQICALPRLGRSRVNQSHLILRGRAPQGSVITVHT
jgi:hypothetical protein